MPEKPEALELERVGHHEDVGAETIERVGGWFGGGVALPVTPQIERDDAVVACERLHMVGKVFLGTAETVYQQEGRGIVVGSGHRHCQSNPVVGGDERRGHRLEARHWNNLATTSNPARRPGPGDQPVT